MAKKRSKKKSKNINKIEAEKPKYKKEEPKIEKISFDVAFSRYKKNNIKRAKLMKDGEAVECFIKKYIKSLEASQEEFNKVLEKY